MRFFEREAQWDSAGVLSRQQSCSYLSLLPVESTRFCFGVFSLSAVVVALC
jgi:hypothetical protein